VRVVLAGLVAAFLIVFAGAVPAGAEPDEGVRVEGSVTYEVQPNDERVRVTMDVTLTNLMPDRGLTYYYFDEIGIPAASEAANVSVRRVGGGALSTGTEETEHPEWQVITVRLSPVLRYGRPQQLEITYDLPNLKPRSGGFTRAMPAFATFLVVPYGDRGHADVQVIVPESYEDVHVGGVEMASSKEGAKRVYTATDIEEPEEWWAVVAARDNSLLAEREIEIGAHEAVLKYWPGDDEWADFASEVATTGIPQLEELIGRPWPVEDELEIVESGVPHVYGFGGWYDSSSDVIEVGDDLDAQIMLHELSHAWFGYEFGTERWFGEGLAELYSNLALERLDHDAGRAKEVPSDQKHALPLATWQDSVREAPEEDEYAYPASWWVISEIYDEIGQAALQEVLASVFDSTIPYVGNTDPEIARGVMDWRRTLDLFEVVGGSSEVAALYEAYVITEEDADQLTERADARSAYDQLVTASGGWGAPLELREAMAYWRFGDVGALIDASEEVLTLRDGVLDVLGGLGESALPDLEFRYAGARPVSDAIAEAELYAEVADALAAAQVRPDGVPGAFTEVGLLGADVAAQLSDAAADLAGGEVDRARATADAALAEVDRASLIGSIVVGEAAVALVLFWPLRALTKRRRRRRAGTVSSDPWPTDEPSSSLSTT
jgi:hypothetical protein